LSVPGPAQPDPARIAAAARAVLSGRRVGVLIGGRTLTGGGLDAAARLAGAGVPVFSTRYAARTESGRGRFQPVRVPYFPEPAFKVLAGLETLILVEAKPPVSFFGYPNTPSALAPESCEFIVAADIEEDGVAALEMLADACGGTARITAASGLPEIDSTAPLSPDTIGQVVASLLPEGAIVSDEMVSSGEAVWKWLLRAAPHDILPVTGGSIGQGLPVAVGAALARPGSKVVALEADGSAMYTLQSLWTMARESLDVVVVIFANRRYRILDIERQRTQAGMFGPAAARMVDIGDPDIDWTALGKSLGVESHTATTVAGFQTIFEVALLNKGPFLIEAVVD
jgi:acetolactate synthase-1/2/3 large subunit